MSLRRELLLLLLATFAVGCVGPAARPVPQSAQPHWTYEGAEGPEAWGKLSADYRACGAGQQQSPVDIAQGSVEAGPLPALAIHYRPLDATELNNGHTVQVALPAGSAIQLGGAQYALQQFHFHHPSEHTLDGRHFPLEIHFVHRGEDGKRVVIGVLVHEGEAHPTLESLFAQLPAVKGDSFKLAVDAASLLPGDKRFVSYPGSLTVPPCGEGVTWMVMTSPISASTAQLHKFAALFPNNSRPTQPLNGRRILSAP